MAWKAVPTQTILERQSKFESKLLVQDIPSETEHQQQVHGARHSQ
jgi:hypothetical protein